MKCQLLIAIAYCQLTATDGLSADRLLQIADCLLPTAIETPIFACRFSD